MFLIVKRERLFLHATTSDAQPLGGAAYFLEESREGGILLNIFKRF
jgi:hypothetical protein